jgi:hypothetical protein
MGLEKLNKLKLKAFWSKDQNNIPGSIASGVHPLYGMDTRAERGSPQNTKAAESIIPAAVLIKTNYHHDMVLK